jgi:hypothetical protein
VSEDRLDRLRHAVDTVTELPVEDRLAVFEDVNAQLASELAALDEL